MDYLVMAEEMAVSEMSMGAMSRDVVRSKHVMFMSDDKGRGRVAMITPVVNGTSWNGQWVIRDVIPQLDVTVPNTSYDNPVSALIILAIKRWPAK
jgi:hypothetical protein